MQRLDPIFKTLAPGLGEHRAHARPRRAHGTAEQGYLHCGANGAGHFVKMVHNGIEYGMMAAYAEGLSILKGANIGSATHEVDAETTPMRDPAHYRYDMPLHDIAEVWRRGSVIASWLLDLTANALNEDPQLAKFGGRVSDSGEGRWTIQAAIDEAVPAPVLTAALYARFSSRGEAEFQDRILSAMRFQVRRACREEGLSSPGRTRQRAAACAGRVPGSTSSPCVSSKWLEGLCSSSRLSRHTATVDRQAPTEAACIMSPRVAASTGEDPCMIELEA